MQGMCQYFPIVKFTMTTDISGQYRKSRCALFMEVYNITQSSSGTWDPGADEAFSAALVLQRDKQKNGTKILWRSKASNHAPAIMTHETTVGSPELLGQYSIVPRCIVDPLLAVNSRGNG